MTGSRSAAPADLHALPVMQALPALATALAGAGAAVLEAPPGAGKSTGVPLALLTAPWLRDQRILVLEPRRLAARAVAARMAFLLGEAVGGTVGYRMRLDTRVGPGTRIEVVTEGILTRQLQHDPALAGVGLVIFDEFHERSLQADLGLALTLDVRRHLRPELRLLVMSATLDTAGVARLLGNVPVVASPGLAFPVVTRHAARPGTGHVAERAATAVRRALADDEGDVLVFLPGAGEIRRTAGLLAEAPLPAGVAVHPLFGDLGREDQDLAIRPAPAGRRKVVLATNIAETSLTIEGIRVVIDGGLARRPVFDPGSGMGRLVTGRISRASADQRRGRAGRLAPGVCYRLWTEAEHRSLLPETPPEIADADLASLALDIAAWGTVDAGALGWLTPPPAGALAQARELLHTLGALDAAHRITPHGRILADFGTHPRLAQLLVSARASGAGTTACALAALLGERDVLRAPPGDRDPDLRTRLALLAHEAGATERTDVDRQALRQVQRAALAFARQLRLPGDLRDIAPDQAGSLLAIAWPDRVSRAREPGSGRFQLSNGRGAAFSGATALARAEFLVIPELDGGDRDARIALAAPLSRADIEQHLGHALTDVATVHWDRREQAVVARRERRLGQLLVSEAALQDPDATAVRAAVLAGLTETGLDALPWTPELRQWQARVLLCRRSDPDAGAGWPDVSDAALLATLPDWLDPWLTGITRAAHFSRIDLGAALRARLDHAQQQRLAGLAPTHLTVPSGSQLPVDYLDGPEPSLSVRLQEVFGLTDTPRIGGGRTPVVLKLLSPARRPVQVTRDLASFWRGTYAEVRRELKGRYPRHYWPEDPRDAEPTRGVRPRSRAPR